LCCHPWQVRSQLDTSGEPPDWGSVAAGCNRRVYVLTCDLWYVERLGWALATE
jgi:hypothetical protein